MPILELQGVEAFYGDLQALWGVSLKVDRGEIACLIGSNGAGKSTLLKAVMGIVPPRAGEVYLEGERIDRLHTDMVVERGVAYVPEGRHPLPDFTVDENLRMGAFPSRARQHVKEELSKVYALFPTLNDRSRQRAGTLSGGEAQMLAIGRALMSKPKLLMLDEPSAGLSPQMVSKIFETILSISRDSIGVLVVEQDVGRALSMSAMGYVLENGRITRSAPGKDLIQDEYVRKAHLGL